MKNCAQIAIILAAGQGKRMGLTSQNKTTLPLNGVPMIRIGVSKLLDICEEVIVVVGNEAQSVIDALSGLKGVYFAYQRERLGTAHAVQMGLEQFPDKFKSTQNVIVAMGDHFAFYEISDFENLIQLREKNHTAISLVTMIDPNASSHGYGRIIRSEKGSVLAIVEQKNCTAEQLLIKEVNVALYTFETQFLLKNIKKIEKNELTQEFYITDLVSIANEQDQLVLPLTIESSHVGVGINTPQDLEEAQNLYKANA